MARWGGVFLEAEISKAHPLWLDVLFRPVRGKPLAMTDPGWHAQRGRAALSAYGTSSCFVARGFPGHCRMWGINMPGDAFRDPLYPGPESLGAIGARG